MKESRWDHTRRAEERLGLFEEKDGPVRTGEFQGRRIIGRDTPIDGGVYVGTSAREGIVVDTAKDSVLIRAITDFYDRLRREVERTGQPLRHLVLDGAFEYTRERLAGGRSVVEEIERKYQLQPDQKIDLGIYLHHGGGVCRHRALFTGVLLERLKKDNYIQGTASVDRSTIPGIGGHAWVRYTNTAGGVYILDAAQNFIGTLQEAIERKEELSWDYRRPTDKL